MYDTAIEINFDVRAPGNKTTRDRLLTKLLKSPGLKISVSGVSKTKFLSSNPDELCHWLKLFLQKVQAGNNSDKINDQIVVILDEILEYKCISEKQHNQFLYKCNLLHTKWK